MNCYSKGLSLLVLAVVLTLSGTGCGNMPVPGSDINDIVATDVQTEDLAEDPGVVPDVQADSRQDTNEADIADDGVIGDVPPEEVSADIAVDDICTPDCTDRDCGDNGCGGSCGDCGVAMACSDEFTCETVDCLSDLTCQPYDAVCDPLSQLCVPCLTPADCPAGSYICLGLVCTEVTYCGSSLDCDAQVCDPARGYCVPCVEDIDCGLNFLCRNAECVEVTPCDSSLDCTGQVCNKDKGYCVNCLDDVDCGENSECIDDNCKSYVPCATDLTCTPDGMLCDKVAGRCARCLEDSHCPDVYHCKDKDCALDICVPDSGSCTGNVAVKCLENGSGFANPVPCGIDQYCQAGVCKDQVCTPDAVTCRENFVETCNSNGSGLVSSVDCGVAAICLDGQCVPRVCESSELECVSDFSVHQCNIHGTAWLDEVPCGADQYCDSGECFDQACVADLITCKDNVLETCNSLGSGLASSLDCTAAAVCMNGSCVPKICVPSEQKCVSDFSVQQCNSTGTDWLAEFNCLANQYCSMGTCYDQTCIPESKVCKGNVLETCNSLGSGLASSLDCTAAAVCMNGSCVPKICVPFDLQCSTNFSWKQCNFYGTAWGIPTSCAPGSYCGSGTCHPQTCSPGITYCLDVDTAALCDARGSGPEMTVPCGDGTTCLGGACLPLLCTPGVSVCSGDGLATCNGEGSGYDSVPCGITQYCFEGSCHEQVCQPFSSNCSGETSEVCNADGSGLAYSIDCTIEGGVCFDGDCCAPECQDKVCGSDGCGGSCGECGADYECNDDGQCVPLGTVLIPAGSFWMGCNEAVDAECELDELPYHQVTLGQYYMDKTEVTVAAYGECVTSGACTEPGTGPYGTWGEIGKEKHPLNYVSLTQAEEFCHWTGKRLPTEAEWEKAARGTDGRKYPWGNETATCEYAVMLENTVYGCGTGSTMDVCSKSPAGDSPYGLCDMAGNVREWVSDLYGSDYYSGSPTINPTGPIIGSDGVARGGHIAADAIGVRSSIRYNYPLVGNFASLGFRCATDEEYCVPKCDGRSCGDDGCGGVCGDCKDGDACTVDICVDGACSHSSRTGRYLPQTLGVMNGFADSDGSFVVVGTTKVDVMADRDYWIARVNPDGQLRWERTFGGVTRDDVFDVASNGSGGFVVAGGVKDETGVYWNLNLASFEDDGDVEWSKLYGGAKDDYPAAILKLDDGFMLAGCSWMWTYGDGWALRTDLAGTVLWHAGFGGADKQWFNDVALTDGGFVFVGTARNADYDGFLVGTDKDGGKLWALKLGSSSGNDMLYTVLSVSDGVVAAGEIYDGVGAFIAWVVKVTPDGAESWRKTFSEKPNSRFEKVISSPNGGFTFGGYSAKAPWVLSVDENMQTAWEWSSGTSGSVFDIIPITEDGVLVTGSRDGQAFFTFLNAHGQECAFDTGVSP